MSLKVTIDEATRISDYFKVVKTEALRITAAQIENEVRTDGMGGIVPLGSTGQLRQQFYTSVVGDTIKLRWGVDYATAVDEGARQHIIRGSPWLSFPDRQGKQAGQRADYDGRAIVTQVTHPGQPAQHFSDAVAARGIQLLIQNLRTIYLSRTGL